MAITELALLHLNDGAVDAALKDTLRQAKQAMEATTHDRFYLYTQVEDPTYIYLVGSWDSLAQHYESWIPSQQNQELLERARGRLDVKWMFHVDLDQRRTGTGDIMPFSAPVLMITRFFVRPERTAEFRHLFEEKKDVLAEGVATRGVSGGWRIERKKETGVREEFVLFTGWQDIPSHEALG
jgi:hypothetical protein